jgi:predicted Zn finger-like uncharacterized protein
MNISCPDCYAVYEVDLPDLEENGEVDVKCVKCQCVFAVHGEPAFSNMEDGEAVEESPAMGSAILQEEPEASPPASSTQDDELDDFLDNLIEREISDAANEPFADDNQDDSLAENLDDSAEQKIVQEEDSNVNEFLTTDDEEDSWAKAFEDDTEQETINEEESASSEFASKADEESSENAEDLWSKAFSEEELGNSETSNEESPSEDDQDFYPGIDLESENEEALASDEYGLKYEDEHENFDDLELKPKKKSGLFSLPEGKTRSLVVSGMIIGVLLIGGSAYFAFQTFAPDGLAEIKKPDSPIPEGLTPKNNSDENIFSTDNDEPEQPASLKESSDNKPDQENKTGIAAELAQSKVLEKSEGVSQLENDSRVSKNAFAALNSAETQVTMSAILPVAYDANDIKILSFTLELDLSNQSTAQRMRETLPVYENILVAGVEGLTSNQFFNDIIYVKEKLRKKFMSDFNESLQEGRVSKARFREFLIQ